MDSTDPVDTDAARKLRHDAKNEALIYLAQAELLVEQAKSIRDRFAQRLNVEAADGTDEQPR